MSFDRGELLSTVRMDPCAIKALAYPAREVDATARGAFASAPRALSRMKA